MVLPGDELKATIKHVGMRQGNFVMNVSTTNQRGEKVLEGTAEVQQPPTVYVFTGQGSQEPGMGMDLYNNSPAARSVWDAADAHLTAVYGFSIIEIVKTAWNVTAEARRLKDKLRQERQDLADKHPSSPRRARADADADDAG